MDNKVGNKGQIVLDRKIRQKLGVEPGWRVQQTWVEDHIEIRLLPPDHNRSLAGALNAYSKPSSLEWDDAISESIAAGWRAHQQDCATGAEIKEKGI